MPKRIHGLQVAVGTTDFEFQLKRAAAARLKVKLGRIHAVDVIKRSLDARQRRGGARWVVGANVWFKGEEAARQGSLEEQARRLEPDYPAFLDGLPRRPGRPKPVIVGTGPAGLFAALTFADHRVPCILLDRGGPLAERHVAVRDFRRKGDLNAESNLCFGEGGAGTYSDGKLYTRKKHPLVRTVYERLVAFGATENILADAHPHIGTNRLYAILKGMREHLLDRGCEVRFGAKMTDIVLEKGKVRSVRLADGDQIDTPVVILATGHSARDVYSMLDANGVQLAEKPFAIGARCEHPQALIDAIQLGDLRSKHNEVEAAEYFLSTKVDDRGLYSFCMCPGGYVIPTPTEPGHLNVNGMSNSNRGGKFANAALVVTVSPDDFFVKTPGDLDHHGVLRGLFYQRAWEKAAFDAGGGSYKAPAQRLTDLAAGKPSVDLPERTSYRPGLIASDLSPTLPQAVIDTLRVGVKDLDRRMRGYFTSEAVLIGVETTTSSPLRIVRDESRQSPELSGLYPTGEGAGYSGGIVSSAIDGIISAQAALETHFPMSGGPGG